jgi:PAS domain S-box-containing protein
MKLQNKILVIEDDQIQSKIIHDILTSENYNVCVANNGSLGIQKAFECNPDLILCDINMESIDGYQVYNVLKESSLIDQIPFIFISGNSDPLDIRLGLDLGADDYFVKPVNADVLVLAVAKKLVKFKKLKEIGKREFKALFQLSPNGIFLFNEHGIFDANPALIQILGMDGKGLTSHSIEDVIDPISFHTIEERINLCSKGLLNSFSETVFLRSGVQQKVEVKLFVSVYEKYSGYSSMIGLVTHFKNREKTEDLELDVLRVLKSENVVVTELLRKQLTDIFKRQNIVLENQFEGFFSKRETEILCLSMEGLPTKLIADQLSISDRTVEKHRANLMEKTNSKNIIEVIVFALRTNLIEVMKFFMFGFSILIE